MSEPLIINYKTNKMDRVYCAGLLKKRIALYALTLSEAKDRAVAHLKPSKSNKGLLWVELAEE